ncbi:TetR/AcrR family transcriptional regulator [Nocardia sp. BMG51109]|uniref:TetR/AcrR family transcriptional regulator n=1 Tax=Nocardia sp. BMG51109 TaxID=1056816 RepID=UPI0004B1346A|nr:TetR/AcrR family transcriptional regulator [Nocardia sp. BMG51109]
MRQVKRPEVRRSEIVAAAAELFAARGYEKTGVADIIGRLGVAKGCFYHHFSSKDEVFAACAETLSAQARTRYLALLGDLSVSPRARLLAYLDDTYDVPMRGGVLSVLHGDRFHDLHSRVAEEVVAEVRPALAALIAEGAAAGEFASGDPEFAATALIGALRGLHEVYAERADLGLRQHHDQVLELIGRMLGFAPGGQDDSGSGHGRGGSTVCRPTG